MPYIKQEARAELAGLTDLILDTPMESPGELNYIITKLCQKYLSNQGYNYQGINDVVGALEGAKMEFYRRVAVPYEDEKINLNGDAYV